MTRLPTPRLTVVLSDDRELTVQALNVDMLKWDRTRAARKWPDGREAPFVWMTFLAWHALRREGQIPEGTTLDDFETMCLSVVSQESETDPTQPGPGPG